MTFILIPLVLILLSLAGIFVIIWKKIPYLKKLSVADVQLGPSVWAEIFPELSGKINVAQLKNYHKVWLSELEKLLRRLRVLFLKIDRISESLIKRIRKLTERKHHENIQATRQISSAEIEETNSIKIQEITRRDIKKDAKKEEQRLIIEIAKDPKNSSLYEMLGDLYIKMGNFSDARESYKAAMELNPSKEELVKKHSQAAEKVI